MVTIRVVWSFMLYGGLEKKKIECIWRPNDGETVAVSIYGRQAYI